jgi:CRISPR-associated protein Cas8b/Csh1 subtype I-B
MKFDKTRPLSTAIASITANIFLEHPVDSTYIVDILYRKIFEESKKGLALDTLVPICLNALITLEYLLFVKIIGGWEKQMEISSSLPVADPMAGEAKKFLDTHSKFLYNGTVRAVCAVGISTGILLETQKRTQNGSVPFWNHVNRLELDLNRIQSLFPQVMNKFYQYNEHKYDGILSYLGTEIANLDPSERGLSNEFVSLVFAVGLSVGYLISRDKLESDI